MKRKKFLQLSTTLGCIGSLPVQALARESGMDDKTRSDRDYWIRLLVNISEPVLSNMSQGLLRKNMPMQFSPGWDKRNKEVAYMEAIGRLLAGIAPFLNLPADDSEEGRIRKKLILQSQQSLVHAVDPASPDYLYWGDPQNRQPLVDAAFLAQAFLAAPAVLWDPLEDQTKKRWVQEFKKLRQLEPYKSNWLLFAAIIESFLLQIGEDIQASRIDNAIDAINGWYVGDGWYKDGDVFHFDHYNGYVIQPMLLEVLKVNVAKGRKPAALYDTAYKRMQRYGQFQERFISPEGYYPVFGRSSTYRAGLFWPLVKLALEHQLPAEILPAQVRCGLTAVLKHLFIPSSFTKEGCLTLGLVGDQQTGIADVYTNTGSLYLTSFVFWALGLPATDPFWSAPAADWTQKKAWSGQPFAKDYAVNY